ncbi:MAG: glycosyltransferase [Clostridia bacterium]|nr:glycosyltransferase [Clostridia bacterium]
MKTYNTINNISCVDNKHQKSTRKISVVVVTADFGMGGISKSLIEWLNLVDYKKYDITLYIRRNDTLDLLSFVNNNVNIVTVDSELKKQVYDDSFVGKTIKLICTILRKFNKKYLAKQIYRWYKYPRQREIEGEYFKKNKLSYDTAIAYSTADDIPIFVLEQIKASRKYLFIHQSTSISKQNQKSLSHFDGVVAVSDNLCEQLKKEFPNKQINFISLPNYVSHSRVTKLANEVTVYTDKSILNLATCGRLVEVKGYDILLETAEKLKKKGLNFIWNWIGDGSERKKLEDGIKSKKLEKEVHILGEKINPYPYIKSCDIYVQPSKAEASPLTIFEALSLGKVVISTKTVGGKYILTKYNCGKLVDFSSDEIAEKIFELATNPKVSLTEQKKVKDIDWLKEENEYRDNWDKLLSGKI